MCIYNTTNKLHIYIHLHTHMGTKSNSQRDYDGLEFNAYLDFLSFSHFFSSFLFLFFFKYNFPS